jgi:hypothetical protein
MEKTMTTTRTPSLRTGALALALLALPALALGADKPIPRTADGHPDLSGTYDVATLTPLQRPEKFGDNLYLTQDQALKIETEEREPRSDQLIGRPVQVVREWVWAMLARPG